jgi:hypothetical protein
MAEFEKAVPEHWLAVLAILQFGAGRSSVA